MDDVFDNHTSSSMISMKFKSNNYSGPRGVVSANSPYARAMPVHSSNSKSHVPSAMASVGSLEELQGPSKSPLPGENLPEHHFKKRYFAESNRHDSTTPTSNASNSSSKNRSPAPHLE